MMVSTGTLFLSNTKPLATVAADGMFALTLLAFDRMGPHMVEPYRITWCGPKAQAFYQAHQMSLVPGTALAVTLVNQRTFTNGRNGTCETVATVKTLALDPYCVARLQAKTPPSQIAACATSY